VKQRLNYAVWERDALTWVEAITSISEIRVPDAVHEQVRPHFTDNELADLTLEAATISASNRLSISARLVPGGYQPTVAAG